MAVVDGLFALIWLTAFSTQAAYNTANSCGTACAMSKAVVALGVFVLYVPLPSYLPRANADNMPSLFFCVSTFLSIYTVKYWQWHNRLPGYDKLQLNNQNIDPDKAAFSLAPHDEEAYAPINTGDHDDHDEPSGRGPRSDYSDPYGAPSSVSDPYGAPSNISDPYVGARQTSNPFQQDNPFDSDTEYRRPSPGPSAAGSARYAPPSAQDELEDDNRPVAFPNANYDRITR